MTIITEGYMVTDPAGYPWDRRVYGVYADAREVAASHDHDYNFVVPVCAMQTGEPIRVRGFEP